MPRPYTLKRRAEQQAETHRRIVEAAIELHGSVGPAHTTLSMVAERAGVQRHTLYAHFPTERCLFLACSGLTMERDPVPDAAPLLAIADPDARRLAGLDAIYAWYGRNAALAACVLRDGEHHALTREMIELRLAPPMRSIFAALAEGLDAGQCAVLGVMLGFHAWRGLVRDGGLDHDAAAAAAARAIAAASPRR